MQNQNTDDRWRELAELLGVPGESAGTSPPPLAKAHEPAPQPSRAAREIEPETRLEEFEPIESPHEEQAEEEWQEEQAPIGAGEADEGDDTIVDDESMHGMSDQGESADETAPAEAGDDQPRRGKRRRRRGRRRGGADKAGEGGDRKAQPTRSDGPRDRRDDSDRKGGKKQDRPDKGQRPSNTGRKAPPPDVEDDATEHSPRGPAVIRDDSDFSDWNVPSWQELISSLYRPDR